MLKNSFIKASKVSLWATLLLCSSYASSVFADDAAVPAITLSPPASNQISVGELVVIHYKIANPGSTEQITFHAGSQNDQWYVLTLRRQGKLVARSPKPMPEKMEGLFLSPERTVLPGDSLNGDIIVAQELGMPAPGRYVLTVHIDLPFYMEPLGVGARYSTPGVPDLPDGIVKQDFDFLLIVSPIDPAKLKTRAEDLEKSLLNPVNAAEFRSFTRQLFRLPEAQALPAWKSLLADPNTSQTVLQETVTQLGLLKTDAAADLLVQMQHRPTTKWGAAPRVDGVLAEMYNTGTPALRQHIKTLAAAQGAILSPRINGISNPN